MGDLKGKVALVTGASRGLGRGIALSLAEDGANIVINFRSSRKEAETLKQQIEEKGCKVLLVKADVSKEEDVQKMFELISKEFGHLDILVNNAGTTKAQNIFETSLEDWDFIIKTNLTSVFLCSKAALEMMKNQGSGRIINISSIVGHRGALFGHVHYASTKSAMFGFTKTLARTAAPLGVTVNCIAPGIIETELLFQTHGKGDVEKLAASVPLGLGKVKDIGLAAAYLAGDGGRYISGSTIDVNGGMYLR